MRVNIYEPNEEKFKRLCVRYELSPTKLVNILVEILDQNSQINEAGIDEIFREVNKRRARQD
jgi:hypothetical protein